MEVPQTIASEKTGKESVIHFESGRHPQTDSEEDTAVYKSFYNGDLDAHGWNKEVGERIASYAFAAPALLLTIDGVPPQPSSAYSLFTPLEEATNIWTRLPARPNKLNHTGKIHG